MEGEVVMNGRDLIVYILQNGLENEPVYENGRLLGFMTAIEAAIKFDVGLATIRTWVNNRQLDGFRIGEEIYIPANSERPSERSNDVQTIITNICNVVIPNINDNNSNRRNY